MEKKYVKAFRNVYPLSIGEKKKLNLNVVLVAVLVLQSKGLH